jgi:hypothetical protein
VELLVVCTILAILMGLALMALAGANEQARGDRTRAEITKLHSLVMLRWEGYRQRPIPIRIPAGTQPAAAANVRMQATWELMRMELPERKSDIIDQPKVLSSVPSLCLAYRRRAEARCGASWQNDTAWTPAYQGADCLYLIIATMRDGDTTGLDFLTTREVGDIDGDNLPEILDGWGNPIEFLRWAPGYVPANGGATEMQTGDATNQHDPFDPLKLYPSNFALTPLIYSAGPDRLYDMNVGANISYASYTPANNPYQSITTPPAIGTPTDADGDGRESWADNMTNHFNVAR